ncbi:MAG: T9SS type A sorting domain-containing protein [Crocinitomicaceae bacterium]|nr:T9SS type A sorting domain-containing protein [Crocinitomicaceae bacterium]
MKKLTCFYHSFALFVTVLISVNAKAQLPDSIAITTDGSWIIEHSETVYGFNPQTGNYEYMTTLSHDYYRSGDDTLIGGLTYTQMLKLPIIASGAAFTSNPQQSESYAFAYRNDMNRRAYKVDFGSTTEELWYDFNPGLGDTLWNPVAVASIPYFVVSEVDSAEFCGTQYERFVYENYPYPNIQRVGRYINFIRSYNDQFIADKIHFFCEASVPFASVTGVEETLNDELLRLFPNPAEDVVELSITNDTAPTQVLIHDIMGNLVFSDESSSNSIAIGHLSSGSYFVSVVTQKGVLTQKLIKK